MITWKKYFVYLADYQHWANDVLFSAVDYLDDPARHSPQGLFFDSIHHTTDHMLSVNRLWMSRLKHENQMFPPFNKIMYPEWRELKNALRQEVRSMQHWLEAQPEGFFEERLAYTSTDNQARDNWMRDVLTQMMNHMTHHRGQISAVATRLGAPAPEMDYLYYKRETDERLEHIKK